MKFLHARFTHSPMLPFSTGKAMYGWSIVRFKDWVLWYGFFAPEETPIKPD